MGESLRDNLRAEYIKSKGMQLRVTEGDYSYFLETRIIEMEKTASVNKASSEEECLRRSAIEKLSLEERLRMPFIGFSKFSGGGN